MDHYPKLRSRESSFPTRYLRCLLSGCNSFRFCRKVVVSAVFLATVLTLFLPLGLRSPQSAPVEVVHAAPVRHLTTMVETPAPGFGDLVQDVDSFLLLKTSTKELMNFSNISYKGSVSSEQVDGSLECPVGRNRTKDSQLPKVSVIFNLHNVKSSMEAYFLLRKSFEGLSDVTFTDDVIFTADDLMDEDLKTFVEEIVDLCSVCRLFFCSGTVYEHRNFVVAFARHSYLVFVDSRVELGENWLQPSLEHLKKVPRSVVSPQLHLRDSLRSSHSVGILRNEFTWDLSVIRAAVDRSSLQTFLVKKMTFLNQTVLTREVFAIRKEFFLDIGKFDTLPFLSGGEDASFSLKVLNCGGFILTSLCSNAYLTLENLVSSTENVVTKEFENPSFRVPQANSSKYYYLHGKVWLDAFSMRYYTCAVNRKTTVNSASLFPVESRSSNNRRASSMEENISKRRAFDSSISLLKKKLLAKRCQIANFRFIISKHQPTLMSPTKYATFYGYIRTLDGVYAFGVPENSTFGIPSHQSGPAAKSPSRDRRSAKDLPSWGNIVFTRNASLWIGPFSFTNGAFIYNRTWCLTLTPAHTLTLARCVRGTVSQLFSYMNHVIRPAGVMKKSACARKASHQISSPMSVNECLGNDGNDAVNEFKFDVEFVENCIK